MARWFRSEPMEYISLIVNEDAAHDCLADLGRMGVIQFTDVSFDGLNGFSGEQVARFRQAEILISLANFPCG
jgi:V-type H+-transporting ATPase subunit a